MKRDEDSHKSPQNSIERNKQQLAAFESRFDMTTAEMKNRLESGDMEETLDTIDCYMESETLSLLEEQHNIVVCQDMVGSKGILV
ncbi:MAG: hypothetical protein NTZ74_09075 [Chloroflexi bacterium]|nr:hypothetical protein [Chloroflexota bacterium]